MWLFVLFDLPTKTKKDKKNAALFRKNLERDGFTMMQFSVYTRHCASRENMAVHEKRVQLFLPPSGSVSTLAIPDKQFGDMKTYYGEIESAKFETPQLLELL